MNEDGKKYYDIKNSKWMAFHNNVNKKMALVNSNDIMLYALGKHTPSIIS